MTQNWTHGNANKDGQHRRGWLVGHFINEDPTGLRTTGDVEIKWANHKAGDERTSWVTGEHRTTMLFLISGKFRINLPDQSILLDKEGDYIGWGKGTDHSWRAETDATVITVRWPSL